MSGQAAPQTGAEGQQQQQQAAAPAPGTAEHDAAMLARAEADIMHIDKTYRRAYNIEPNMCWECYSCVKACPQHAIDVRGYAPGLADQP